MLNIYSVSGGDEPRAYYADEARVGVPVEVAPPHQPRPVQTPAQCWEALGETTTGATLRAIGNAIRALRKLACETSEIDTAQADAWAVADDDCADAMRTAAVDWLALRLGGLDRRLQADQVLRIAEDGSSSLRPDQRGNPYCGQRMTDAERVLRRALAQQEPTDGHA